MKNPDVILVSGGLDSYGLWKYFLHTYLQNDFKSELEEYAEIIRLKEENFKLIHFSLGQPYEEKELKIVKELYPKELLHIVNISGWIGSEINEDDYIIKARNLAIVTIAANFGKNIWVGGITDENHEFMLDKNTRAMKIMSEVISELSGSMVEAECPFFELGWNKIDIIKMFILMKDLSFNKTSSCYHPTELRCGECVVCLRRWIAEKHVENIFVGKDVGKFPPFKKPINLRTNKHAKDMINNYWYAYTAKDFRHYHKERMVKDLLIVAQSLMDEK